MTLVSVWLTLSASETCLAPSTSSELFSRLQKRVESECQRLLTVGIEVRGGVLEVLEDRVRLEGLSQHLCTIWADVIERQTANMVKIQLSAAADSWNPGKWCLLERLEGLVRLERLSERLRTLWTDAVVLEAASTGQIGVSAAADRGD